VPLSWPEFFRFVDARLIFSTFLYQRRVTSGILAMEFGEHLSSDKESEVFRRQSTDIHWNPLVPCSIDIIREYYGWIPMSFFTNDKVSGA